MIDLKDPQYEIAEKIAEELELPEYTISVRGNLKDKATGKPVLAKAIQDKYLEVRGTSATTREPYIEPLRLLELLKDIAATEAEANKVEEEEDKINVQAEIEKYLERYVVDSTQKTFKQQVGQGTHTSPRHTIANQLYVEWKAAIPLDRIRQTLEYVIEKRKFAETVKLHENLAYNPEKVAETEAICHYFFQFYGIEDTPENLVMFMHWLWQLKRSVFGLLKGRYPIMLVMFGQSSIGKSSFASRGLESILRGGYAHMGMEDLKDNKECRARLGEAFVMELPELDHGDTAPNKLNELLKRRIDADYVSSRDHNLMTSGATKVSCVFLGTTNKPLAECVYDSTGMRRYWQLTCTTKTPVTTRIAEATELFGGFETVLQGIDESNELGYFEPNSDAGVKIIQQQHEYIKQDNLELYLEDRNLLPVNEMAITSEDTVLLKSWALFFADYLKWAVAGKFRVWRNIQQAREFMELKYSATFKSNFKYDGKLTKELSMFCVLRSKRDAAINAQQQTLTV